MKAPFQSTLYNIDVITPVHIGDSKEKEYVMGQDYYYEHRTQSFHFFNKRELQKLLGAQLSVYVTYLINSDVLGASKIVSQICQNNPELITRKVKCPYSKETIQKVYTTGLGKPTIPGSSIKGALRSIFGKMIMSKTGKPSLATISDKNSKDIFGGINDNFMRLIQVSDVSLDMKTEIFPFKIYSGDVKDGNPNDQFNGIGMWKDKRIGGHEAQFNERGFESFFETYAVGSRGNLKINIGEGLVEYIQSKAPQNLPKNSHLIGNIKNSEWLNLVKLHSTELLNKEKRFFEKFKNDDFDFATDLIDELLEFNNEPDSALLRIGHGSGFHSITGDWQYSNYTNTGIANTHNAIKYKTRKVAFSKTTDDDEQENIFFFPGYVLISKKQ